MEGSILGMEMGTGRIMPEHDGRREDWVRQLELGLISGTS